MSNARDRREERRSTARRRAESHASGFSTTTLKLPDGVSFFNYEEGMYELDFIPFIAKKGNPFADPGELHYERTYWRYQKIGPEEKKYVCSSKTFGKKDYIQEYCKEQAKNPNSDPDALKALEPKERQIFLVRNRKKPDDGLLLFEISYHHFGKLLDARIKASPESRGWDFFYFPDETGFTLEVTFKKSEYGVGAISIDFIRRDEPLPKSVVEHGFCLDDFLVETSYEDLKKAFLGIVEEEEGENKNNGEGGSESPKREEETPREDKKKDEKFDDRNPFNGGAECFKRGKDMDANPFKDGTDSYEQWLEGWISEKKKAKASEKPKEEPKNEPTATSMGIKRDTKVEYKGKKFVVMRILDDDKHVTLLDEEDEMHKNIPVTDLKIATEKVEKKEEPKEEAPFKEDKKDPPKGESQTSEGEKKEDDWDKDW